MFYSHQLLARKAPLGQIWMAATMHQKINRRNLDKLNIIKICEEILYPSVPMALRLSGILMGGVVIVYERKVKLLYDDVTRLLVEINQAWKVNAAPDPTVLPKGKSQAKYEAVTLREKQDAELGETEKSLPFTESATMMGFQQTTYISMRLDDMDEQLISSNRREEEDRSHHYHQADTANITLSEHFDTYQTNTDLFNRFERFDIEGDEETRLNITPPNQEIPSTIIPSPEIQPEPSKPDEIQEQHPEDNINQHSDEAKEANQPQRVPQRRARKVNISMMDYQQTVLPGQMYQSWLRTSFDIIGRKRKHTDAVPAMKIPKLMELPSLVLVDRLFVNGTGEIYYSSPLLKLSMTSVQPLRNSPASRASPPPPSSSASPPERARYQDPVGFAFEEVQNVVDPQSREKQRAIFEEPKLHFVNQAVNATDNNIITTPGNSGTDARSIPSSGSGHGHVSNTSDTNSGRLKRKQYSSPRIGSGGLEPVIEERSWQDFELAPENDLIVETGPTQTQKHPIVDQQIDQITDSIRTQLKMHFETPGSTEVVSLNQLADRMNRKRAACLFYQTCVLATRGFARVKQEVAYGDIFISRGAKM